MATSEETPKLKREDLKRGIREHDGEELERLIEGSSAGERTHALARLSEDDLGELLVLVEPDVAADVLEALPESQAADALEELEPGAAAEIVHELPSDEQADLLAKVDDPEAILTRLDSVEAAGLRGLKDYASESAGGLMATEFLAFTRDDSVEAVVAEMQARADELADYDVQYVYVLEDSGQLSGVLRLRDLLLSPRSLKIHRIMIADPLRVQVDAELEELDRFFRDHAFLAVPAVDEEGRLVGVVREASVDNALALRQGSDLAKSGGIVGGEELRSMPLRVRSGRRLSWLSINVVLNLGGAAVIALHQETLREAIALAVFLPIISDMSGCSGNQAVAVSMRELSLGVTQPRDAMQVLWKEVMVGLINGAVLGLLVAGIATLWEGDPMLGAVVGLALAVNTVLAVGIGGTVPLMLKRLGQDPALASGPILTTVTDMCGFLLALTLAAHLL